MDLILPIILMLVGIWFFYSTYNDGKKRERKFVTSYIMHLKGYIGGIGLFLIGLIMLLKKI